MFEITPCTQKQLQVQLHNFSEQLPAECKAQLLINDSCEEQMNIPFVQLSYDEIDDHQIERLLGYAEISSANAPIGMNGDFEPMHFGSEARSQILIFSLTRLEEYLIALEPDIVKSIRSIGSMDTYVEQRGDSLTAIEYITGGVLACIEFCKKHNRALVITW